MRQIADMLDQVLTYYDGAENKKAFLNKGRAFLRALGKDLGLSEMKVSVNPGGIAVSGDCTLIDMWENTGIYVWVSQFYIGHDALLYREVRHMKDYSYGYNRYLRQQDLRQLTYPQLLDILLTLK